MAFEMVESKKEEDSLRRERKRWVVSERKKSWPAKRRPFWKTQRRKRGAARLDWVGGWAALRACEGFTCTTSVPWLIFTVVPIGYYADVYSTSYFIFLENTY
jgi:hypothetical protein